MDWFRDDRGFTAPALALAILLCLSLLFATAQVYEVQTASAEVQEVADAAALSAQSVVGEFMIAVHLCDAAVLSLSLLSTLSYGLGVVALCIPPVASLGTQLIEFGSKVAELRDRFAQTAAQGLNSVQQLLPFLAAAKAMVVAAANSDRGGSRYVGFALLVPMEAPSISVGSWEKSEELRHAVEESQDSLQQAAALAQAADEEAQALKLAAYQRDCGDYPNYCMEERASHLAALTGSANPHYQSVDAWSFSVALARTQAYYRARAAQESPATYTSPDEQMNSALRSIFYSYAEEQMAAGYVHETDASFEAYLPLLPKNTEELRQSSLYGQPLFPVTQEEGAPIMHGWSGCAAIAGATTLGSLRQLEEGGYASCPACCFTVSDMGRVAAASSAIENGFEYHYRQVAELARAYEIKISEAKQAQQQAKEATEPLLADCAETARSAASQRINATPPGYQGALSFVVSTGSLSASEKFSSLFVSGDGRLGMRLAVAGATLVAEPSDEGATVINGLLDGFGPGGAFTGAARLLLDGWSWLLRVYGEGQEALIQGVKAALSGLPLVGSSLGSWASKKLSEGFATLGLEPVSLEALKPVLVNTASIAKVSSSEAAQWYREARERALSLSDGSPDAFDGLRALLQDQSDELIAACEKGIELGSIELPVGSLSIPLVIALPPELGDKARRGLEGFYDQLEQWTSTLRKEESWA